MVNNAATTAFPALCGGGILISAVWNCPNFIKKSEHETVVIFGHAGMGCLHWC